MGIEMISDCIKKIQVVMKEDRFSKEELQLIKKSFEMGVKVTDNVLNKIMSSNNEETSNNQQPKV